MAKVILGMTMSLDGFINDRYGSVGSLYPDLDELEIDIMPILLCKGLRLFEYSGEQPIKLEKIKTMDAARQNTFKVSYHKVIKQAVL